MAAALKMSKICEGTDVQRGRIAQDFQPWKYPDQDTSPAVPFCFVCLNHPRNVPP